MTHPARPGGRQPPPPPLRGPRGPPTLPHVRQRNIKPLTWPHMEGLSRRQVRLLRRLEWLLPVGLLTGEMPAGMKARLRDLFDEDVRMWPDYAHVVSRDRLPKIVVDPTFLATVNPAPQGSRGLIELELSLAHAAIDLLLGANSSEATALRPLTEIEEGVLSYVLLETLRSLVPELEPMRPRLRLERILAGAEEAMQVLAGEQEVAAVQFKLLIGVHPGFLRLILPGSLLASVVPPLDSPDRRARRLAQVEKNLARLSGVRTSLRVEIGRAELSLRDFAGLRKGDVVIVEDVTARPDKGEGGTAKLRVGTGRSGRLDAEVLVEGGRYKVKISSVTLGATPGGARQAEAEAQGQPAAPDEAVHTALNRAPPEVELPHAGGQAEEAEIGPRDPEPTDPAGRRMTIEEVNVSDVHKEGAAELLNDVPMQVSVELGRLAMTAEEVVALHVGQVLEINKVPGEPVDLSVAGKLVARGELVEVEGQIGVRILSVTG